MDQVQSEYLPDVISELLNDHQERVAERSTIVTPQKVLANLRRLRLRCGVRVADVQDLTRLQPDGKVTVAEFRRLLHEVGIAWNCKITHDLTWLTVTDQLYNRR